MIATKSLNDKAHIKRFTTHNWQIPRKKTNSYVKFQKSLKNPETNRELLNTHVRKTPYDSSKSVSDKKYTVTENLG